MTRARNGDQQAWDALVERYAPLIWSICRRHRLGGADAGDVGQSVWLHLVDQPARDVLLRDRQSTGIELEPLSDYKISIVAAGARTTIGGGPQ